VASIGVAAAQTAVTMSFSYRNVSSPTANVISSNGTIQMGSITVGQTARVVFNIMNAERVPVTISRIALTGEGFTSNGRAPVELRAVEATSFEIEFAPTAKGVNSGNLTVEVTEGSRRTPFTFFLGGIGVAPDLVLSYLIAGGNQTALTDGTPLRFPDTTIGQSTSATIFITNRGNGPATLTRASVDGPDVFRLSGLPLLPVEIAADRDVRFTVTFTPTQRERGLGLIRLETNAGARLIVLEGPAVSPSLTYSLKYDDTEQPVDPSVPVVVPETAVGVTRNMRLVIRNNGNIDGRITTLSISGAGFQFGDLPIVPATIAPGRTLELQIAFTPTQAGTAIGRVRIDGTIIEITVVSLGSRLSLTAATESGSVAVTTTAGLSFPTAALGTTSVTTIRVENTGNVEATVAGISTTGNAFQLEQLPGFPAKIPAGGSLSFRLKFVPDVVGALAGNLQLDDLRYPLRGTGAAPDPIGSVSFALIGDSVTPLQQPAVGLTLEKPYALPLTGKLNLAFISESFSEDQTIQFATGGRTVDFRIPAGSTEAIFGESARQILFQAGTVAGQISLAATFQYGSVNLTPSSPPTKNITVARSEPRLRTVQVVLRSSTTMEIIVSGYSTPRSVSRMDFQFTAVPGAQLQGASLSADVDAAFNSWYQGSASRAFGSQFTASVTVNASGDLSAVQSVSVTATNSNGVSSPVTANLR